MSTKKNTQIAKNFATDLFKFQKSFCYRIKSSNVLGYVRKCKKSELPTKNVLIDNIDTVRNELDILFEKERIAVLAKQLKVSQKECVILENKANAIADSFNMDYSMGAVVSVVVKKRGNKFITVGLSDTTQEYSNSSKYRAVHGSYWINLSLNDLRKIEIIGGLPTIKHSKNKISKCSVLVSKGLKQYFEIVTKEMFITSDFHADTYAECENWRKEQAIRFVLDRKNKKDKVSLSRKFVGLQHSINSGNCKQGTLSFAQKHNLNPEMGYRLDYLLSLEPQNQFVKNLFKAL